MAKIVAVIPAFNEEQRVGAVVADALRFAHAVVVVDDCSHDQTAGAARRAGAFVLRHALNRGQGAAIQTATDFALTVLGADVIVHLDADGQMDAADIPHMVAPIVKNEADIVLGSRFLGKEGENMPTSRRITLMGARWFTLLVSGVRLTDAHNGFRALSKDAAKNLRISLDRMAHASEIIDVISARRLRVGEYPVSIRYTPETLEKSLRAQGGSVTRALRVVKDIVKKRLIG